MLSLMLVEVQAGFNVVTGYIYIYFVFRPMDMSDDFGWDASQSQVFNKQKRMEKDKLFSLGGNVTF